MTQVEELARNLPDVVSHHHLKDAQEFFFRYQVIIVCVVHFECKAQLAFTRVKLVLPVLPDWPEMGEDFHELAEVQLVLRAGFAVKGVDNAVTLKKKSHTRNETETVAARCSNYQEG